MGGTCFRVHRVLRLRGNRIFYRRKACERNCLSLERAVFPGSTSAREVIFHRASPENVCAHTSNNEVAEKERAAPVSSGDRRRMLLGMWMGFLALSEQNKHMPFRVVMLGVGGESTRWAARGRRGGWQVESCAHVLTIDKYFLSRTTRQEGRAPAS